jgi:site-specific recombinase XerD
MRLGAVRGFARYLHEADPRVEVPAADLLPDKSGRAVPYLYTDAQIVALIEAASTLRIAHKTATFQTLFGLLVATGMRIGEALALDRSDFDADAGTLTVRNAKFGKSRELPLHPTTTSALTRYLRRRDRPRPVGATEALLLSSVGTRVLVADVQTSFRALRARAGILPRSAACRPRLHDMRHSFAVNTLLDAYRTDGDPASRVAALSTYLGHVNPGKTYWYLHAAPELLELAGRTPGAPPRRPAMSALASSLQAWFTDRLIRERNASPHTIASYRDTIRLLLIYASKKLAVEPSRMDLGQLDAPLIAAFLDHLEAERGCSPRTRNTRLAAIRTFYRYCLVRYPEHAATIERVLEIGPKRHERALVTYLTEPELDALIGAPDRSSWTGRRDHAIIVLLAQTGLRASELTGLACGDIHLGNGAHVTTTGKGRKQRITPLTKDTQAVLRAWLAERGGQPTAPLFPTSTGTPLTRKALARRIAQHATYAADSCRSLTAKTITPHVLRHTAAMRLLHAGVDTTVIALWLGHEQVETTQMYLHADLALKERALARTKPLDSKPGRYRPPDALLGFLDGL